MADHQLGLVHHSLGKLVIPSQRIRPEVSAPKAEWIHYEWEEFCKRIKKVVAAEDGSYYVPPLLRWEFDPVTQIERYFVALPGAFDTMQPRIEIPDFLRASKGAHAATVVDVPSETATAMLVEHDPPLGPMPVVKIVLSHFELPSLLPFSWDDCPVSRGNVDQVDLGLLNEGSRLVLDFTRPETPHALIVGSSGSGKSEAAATILTQLHLTGQWHFIILSPDEGDPTYSMFGDLGHDVVLGSEPEHFERAAELVHELTTAEYAARGKERGAQRVPVWGQEPTGCRAGYEWRGGRFGGKRVMVVFEECKYWLHPTAADSKAVLEAKEKLNVGALAVAEKGRKYRTHGLWLAQSPYVKAFGPQGGEILGNIGIRLAVRSLEKKHLDTVFPDTASLAPAKVLFNSSTPPGRGICRGAVNPGGEFGASIDDTPVQIAHLNLDGREKILALGPDTTLDEATVDDPDGGVAVVRSTTPVVADGATLRLVGPEPVAEPALERVPLMEAPVPVTVLEEDRALVATVAPVPVGAVDPDLSRTIAAVLVVVVVVMLCYVVMMTVLGGWP
jgi:hypothetical protein